MVSKTKDWIIVIVVMNVAAMKVILYLSTYVCIYYLCIHFFHFLQLFFSTYLVLTTVLHTTVGPTNVYKKSEGQIMQCLF